MHWHVSMNRLKSSEVEGDAVTIIQVDSSNRINNSVHILLRQGCACMLSECI